MKKMPKKFKRFAEGGMTEDEDKAEGLRRSAGEKVGLLERLRMGNIDDPSSEAYKRFGAGRARIDRELAPAAYKNQAPNMAGFDTPAPDALEEADRRFRETGPLDTTAGPRAPMAAPARPMARPPMPTAPARPAARPPAPSRPAAPMGAGAGRGMVNPSVADLQAATRVATPPTPAGRAEIPGAGPYKAPASTGEMPGELERNVRNTLNALGPGAGRLAMGATFKRAGDLNRADRTAAMAQEISKAAENVAGSAGKVTPQVAKSTARFTPKQEMEAAESTVRGATSRKAVQAKRAEGQRKSAEAMEEAKPILKARPGKAKPTSKTKYDEDNVEYRKGGKIKAFAKGGSVSSASTRADGCAMRGKTRGRIY